MHRLNPLLILLALGCGGAATATLPPDTDREHAVVAPTEFERVAALPSAPRLVVELDMDALRPTSIFTLLRTIMSGDGPDDILARRLLERTQRVTVGAYGEGDDAIVMIVRGPVDGVLATLIGELGRQGHPVAPMDRLGFTAYFISGDIVAVQTAPDTVVLANPHLLDEVLRGAAGRAPASPLPPAMQHLAEHPALRGASMFMIFVTDRERGDDPLSNLLEEAGVAGVGGNIEAGELSVVGVAELPDESGASQRRAELERSVREITLEDVGSPSFAEALRNTVVRGEGAWIEVALRFAPSDIEAFMAILQPLGD